MNRILVFTFLSAFSLSGFLLPLLSQEVQKDQWRQLSEKEKKAKLRSIAYAKIRSQIQLKLKFTEEITSVYTTCPSAFPALPGDFPCNFLSLDGITSPSDSKSTDSSSSESLNSDFLSQETVVLDGETSGFETQNTEPIETLDGIEGGVVVLSKNKIKSPLLEGDVFLLSQDKDEKKDPEAIRMFYLPSGQLSHYTYKNEILYFHWKKDTEGVSLHSSLRILLDKQNWPTEIREIDFSQRKTYPSSFSPKR